MKRIVIGCDGTWNTPDQSDKGKRKPTNIVKLIRAVRPLSTDGVHQISYYDKGIGTHWGISRWIEGATGYGISTNIIDAYQFLCLNYVEGDQIYLFGFSRGAFTVQSLVGLISRIGILPKNNVFYIPEAYEIYRSGANTQEFRRKNRSMLARIQFLGVFDTVGALGIPVGILNSLAESRHHFHDVRLNDIVDQAYHALAIDEQRKQFVPTLWQPDKPVSTDRMEQVWYAGVHSNIGGGYEPDGLANIPLQSIKKRACDLGLDLDRAFLNHYQSNANGDMQNPRTGIYRLAKKLHRQIGLASNGNERVHSSVLARMKSKTVAYKPGNVPQDL